MSEYGVINVGVSTHYSEPTSLSAVVTQGVLNEKVEILDKRETHILVCQADGYQSWIPEDQLVPESAYATSELMVRTHFMPLFEAPDLNSLKVRDAVIGCFLHIIDEQMNWYQILLPDGVVAWAEKLNFAPTLQFSSQSIISLACEFLGYQYLWGGCTPKGFDCSGFVQTVFGIHSRQLPRDSWQQQQNNQFSSDYRDAQPGDLLFFSNKPDTVTHVAISLGQQRYIHASGWVRLDSFNENDDIFEKQRAQSFVSVNRYPLVG